MSGLQRPASLEALNTSLFKNFQDGLQVQPFGAAEQLWTEVLSTTEFNTYAWMAAIPGMREWIGPRLFNGLKERAFTVYNKRYEDSIAVNLDRLNDGQVADSGMAMRALGEAAAMLPEDNLTYLLENGQSILCYDGQFLFDTDHPQDLDGTGTQRNYYASGLALTGPNLDTIMASMWSFKGENGRPLRSRPSLLVVPPALYKTAVDLVEAKTVSAGGENTQTKYNLQVAVLQRAASATRYWVMDNVSPGPRAFIRQINERPRFQSRMNPQTDDAAFQRNEAQFGATAREGMGPGLWSRIFSASA